MGKSIDIPDNISKTPIVEEFFRNMKNAPENNQSANAANSARSLEKDFFDVVNLTGINPDEQNEKKEEKSLLDQEKKSDQNQEETQLEDNDEAEDVQKPFNKKGKLLDIEG